MYIPRDVGDPVRHFRNLVNEAILITDPVAARFVQSLTPRDLSNVAVGR